MAPSKFCVLAVLLVVCRTCVLASNEDKIPIFPCSVGGPEPIPCTIPAGSVCVLSGQDPHTGLCETFDTATMCNYSSTYYRTESTFPKGDDCNNCTCVLTGDDTQGGAHASTNCTSRGRCQGGVCKFAKCPAFPEARCMTGRCGCSFEGFFVNGHKVNCSVPGASTPVPTLAPCPPCTEACKTRSNTPVCCDGDQYENECEACSTGHCHGCVPGPCRPVDPPSGQCICPEIVDPVCSSDPKDTSLYGNECLASCQGATPPFHKCGLNSVAVE